MEMKQIEYFLQLARLEHMSQAADALDIAQPTLSKSLHALEREIGVPLFDRVGNRIRLNASGKRFYSYAQQAMQALNVGTLSAKELMYETAGNITIVCLTFAPILMPCISEYTKLNPNINIQLLQYNHHFFSTEGVGDYDFILASAQDSFTNEHAQFWVTQPLFSEGSRLVIGPNHPLYAQLPEGESVDLNLFRDARFVTMRLEGEFIDFTYHICQNAGFFPRSFFQTDDFLLKMNAVREGLAVAFLPEACLGEAEFLCPGLRCLRVENYNMRRTIVLQRKKKHMLHGAALDFWDFVLEHYDLPADQRE